eukprot:CAMPEP_0116121928 /NCGR_PEP_ID=MMETSP0329-20121206/3950_1 /TAXON_ID=697910 /ORGANISM="Pseudo-nitzschia arenysensis, Strain B593" /LENGTH=1201 /DNA_ID=CAMNT_0003615757 /DNA_START=180 /DNA_END=3785 /DNA_ORIENTATION=-
MFKNVPFQKGKEGSKNIVGRVVEVEGKEVDENCNTDNKIKSSASVQKSTISTSVSKIFGASPFKKTSTTRTPGRKLLKKLICTPGKSRSHPDTSISEVDDFGAFIPNNNSGGLTVSRSTSSDDAKEINSIQASNSGHIPSSPPRLARRLLAEHDKVSIGDISSNQIMKTPTKSQNDHISNNINSSKRIDDALVAASNRSGFNEDMIFLTNSSSDDELDHRNESEGNQMSRMKYSSPYSSPQRHETRSSPTKVGQFAMKSPGMSIPTPAVTRAIGAFMNGYSGSELAFPHPLGSVENSPMDKMNTTTPNPKNLSTQFEEFEDDDAFLPDDFVDPNNKQNQNEGLFTVEQVERMIREAKREERLTLREQQEKDKEELQNEFEKILQDSGTQWKKDSDEQEAKYQKNLKEERRKTSLKHHELINNAQSLQDVMEKMKEMEAERDLLEGRVLELETNDENMASAASQDLEIQSLRREKSNAENRVLELESERQEFESLRQDKESADQKTAELSEQFRLLTDSSEQSQSQLEQALEVVDHLKGQLSELCAGDLEEIRTSKLEIENLRNLRAEDGKEIQALQDRLSEMVDEHRDAISPQKKSPGKTDSPCVGEIDMLRVSYDKAQEQLKSMGRILKRYKAEKDDLKGAIDELEERHVQAIEIAVKLATHDQKEKVQMLTEENEALRQKPIDIGEQMLEEMKNHMEDLKRSHEEEIARLREALNDQAKAAEGKQEAMLAEYEIEKSATNKTHEEKIENMVQEMDKLRSSQYDEISIMRTNSKDEVDCLQSELRQLRTAFENEKTEIIEQKRRECVALEDQIKSMNEMHSEELELVASESREEIDVLKKKVRQLELDLGKKSSGVAEFERTKFDLQNALTEAKEFAKAEKERLLMQIDSLEEEKEAETQKSSRLETQLVEIRSESAARFEKVKEDYDRQIREVKSEHASESDELLAQLDLIEAEAAQRFKNAEATVTEKDSVITVLGSQLAESESRAASTFKEFESLKEEVESLRSDLEVVTSSNEASKREITKLVDRHEKEIEEQVELREAACNEAREEMIALAEGQLAERQEYYQALKRELDNAQSKISMLERDMRFATKEMEEMGKRNDAREADLRDELAQSKAATATKEANRIRAEKLHQTELERTREAEKVMRSKYEESQATSNSIQKTLAGMVTEKQRLEQELAEVTAISEELATICEKNKLM